MPIGQQESDGGKTVGIRRYFFDAAETRAPPGPASAQIWLYRADCRVRRRIGQMIREGDYGSI